MSLRSLRTPLALVIAASLLLSAGTVAAQTGPSDKATAEALFDEARALLKDGKPELACPKLAESQRIDPGIGTLLYLASCYEKTGKLASAWVTFREAAVAASRAGQTEREKVATTRAEALLPQLPRLTIQPAPAAGDVEITRDGVAVGRALWGTALPVDPGSHVVEVKRAGHKPRTLEVAVTKGQTVVLAVEPLDPEAGEPKPVVSRPPPSPAPSPSAAPDAEPPRPAEPSTARRVAPFAAAGVGAIGLAVGTVFGLRAFSLASDVDRACPSGPCSASTVATADDSRAAGNVSTVAFGVAVVGIAAAAVLWMTAPHNERAAARVSWSGLSVRAW